MNTCTFCIFASTPLVSDDCEEETYYCSHHRKEVTPETAACSAYFDEEEVYNDNAETF